MEKKILSISPIRTGDRKGDLSKLWFVEYYIIFEDNSKKRVRIYANINTVYTAEERYQIAKDLSTKIEADLYSYLPKQTNSILATLLDYLETQKSYFRHKTYMGYRSKIKIFSKYLSKEGIKTLDAITILVAQNFISFLQSKDLNNATLNNYIVTLSSLFKQLKKLHKVPINPFIELEKHKENPQGAMYFKEHQIPFLREKIQQANPLLWLACQALYYCFIRPGEMRMLKVGDIDLIEGTINIRAEISKNKKSQTIVIPESFLTVLYALNLHERAKDEFFLCRADGSQLPTNYLNTEHRKIMKQLHYGERYVFYSWKHTGVVMVAKAGLPLKELQMQLRHHSLDQVNEYLRELGIWECNSIKNLFPKI